MESMAWRFLGILLLVEVGLSLDNLCKQGSLSERCGVDVDDILFLTINICSSLLAKIVQKSNSIWTASNSGSDVQLVAQCIELEF